MRTHLPDMLYRVRQTFNRTMQIPSNQRLYLKPVLGIMEVRDIEAVQRQAEEETKSE